MQRREYMAGIVGTAGVLTVSPTGEVSEHEESDVHNLPDQETPPRKGDSVMGLTVDPIKPVRTGVIGLGNRGSQMIELIDAMHPDKGVIKAICDLREKPVQEVHSKLKENGQNPDTYSGSKNSWKKLVQRDDLDAVFIFTPHNLHTPMAVEAMKQGKHAFTEVPAATTIKDCWKLVDTAEKTQKHCMMMENVCYFENEMWVLNMVRNGVFGDQLTYGAGAYIHPLVNNYFLKAYWNDWRARHHLEAKGDLYPTHGLGPIAQDMHINRGNRFEYMVSMESPETGLTDLAKTVDEDNWAYGRDDWANGDTTMSLIKTHRDQPIHLQLDVKTNRGYSRKYELAGDAAFHQGFPESQLAVDKEGEEWVSEETYERYHDKYRHPLWEQLEDLAEKYGGHGGGDFIEIYRIFDALNNGRPLDQGVYDAAAWSAPVGLSAISIKNGSKPVKFPDFTRGKWEEERELQVMDFDTIPGTQNTSDNNTAKGGNGKAKVGSGTEKGDD